MTKVSADPREEMPDQSTPLSGHTGSPCLSAGWRGLALGSVLLVTAACAGDGGDADVALTEGQALYEANCMACHGETALGDGPMASSLPVDPPPLKEHLGHHSQAELVRLIRGGVPPAMPPVALDEDQVLKIVDYLWSLVPEDEVDALREMQRHMEMMGDSGMHSRPGMEGSGGMRGMEGMNRPDSDSAASSMEMAAPESES